MRNNPNAADNCTSKWLHVPATLALCFLILPFLALALRVDWAQLPLLLTTTAALDALWLSLKTCVVSTLLCLIFGAPLALWLASSKNSWISKTIRVLVTLPMVLPPVVAGIALLITWGRTGLLGSKLHLLGIEIGFSTLAVVIAQTFVAIPFMITSLEGALRSRGFNLENAARNLGASQSRTLFLITIPLSAPALASATALAFSRSLGEFGATLTFAGSLQGVTRTLPLEIYLQRESDTDSALALSVVLIAIAVILIGFTQTISLIKFDDSPKSTQNTTFEKKHVPVYSKASLDKPSPIPPLASPGIRVHADFASRGINLDLEFPPQTTTVLIGPNGAGKTTILNLISGMIHSKNSRVEWVNSEGQPEKYQEPLKIVQLTQNPALFPHMTCLQNVVFALRCHGVCLDEAKLTAQKQLTALGIDYLAEKRPGQLSGGQAQRVAIARALSIQPQIVLLDEPMSGLDIEIADQLRHLLNRHLKNITAVIVTHNLSDVVSLGKQVVLIRDGKVIRKGTCQEIFSTNSDRFTAEMSDNWWMQQILNNSAAHKLSESPD